MPDPVGTVRGPRAEKLGACTSAMRRTSNEPHAVRRTSSRAARGTPGTHDCGDSRAGMERGSIAWLTSSALITVCCSASPSVLTCRAMIAQPVHGEESQPVLPRAREAVGHDPHMASTLRGQGRVGTAVPGLTRRVARADVLALCSYGGPHRAVRRDDTGSGPEGEPPVPGTRRRDRASKRTGRGHDVRLARLATNSRGRAQGRGRRAADVERWLRAVLEEQSVEDGPAGRRCSGTFTSAAWQVLGLGLVVVGVVVVVAAVASAVVAPSRLTR